MYVSDCVCVPRSVCVVSQCVSAARACANVAAVTYLDPCYEVLTGEGLHSVFQTRFAENRPFF